MKLKKVLLGVLLLISSTAGFAYTNSGYFMHYLPYKMYMNPALQPNNDFGTFVELPISTIYASAGSNTNAFTFSNMFQMGSSGQMLPFYNANFTNKEAFYNKLKDRNIVTQEASVSIFGFGFRVSQPGYLTVNLSVRELVNASIPKDAFNLFMFGMSDINATSTYSLSGLSASAHVYLDLSGGYSHQINKKVKVGARLHTLVSVADASVDISNLNLTLSAQEWKVEGQAQADYNFPGLVNVDDNGNITGYAMDFNSLSVENYSPSLGYTVDFGVEYKPIEDLSLSLSFADLGILYSPKNYHLAGTYDFSFSGTEIALSQDRNVAFMDTLTNKLKNSGSFSTSSNKVVQMMNAKLYAAAEYSFVKNMMSVGVLSKTVFNTEFIDQEITLAYTIRPCRFVELMASYSFFSGGFSTLGAGINICVPGVNLYVVTDYLPLYYSAESIPSRSQAINVQAGIVLTFGGRWNETKAERKAARAAEKSISPDSSLAE